MTIYVSHSRDFDFDKGLYQPIKNSELAKNHNFIFPHDKATEIYPIKELLQNKKCDLILAEVSFPSTGQGIELGWANLIGVKILCVHKEDKRISGSIKTVTENIFSYKDSADLINKLVDYLKNI